MNKQDVIEYLEKWIKDEPAETAGVFIIHVGQPFSLQDILLHVQEETVVGLAFMKCLDDVENGTL